MTKAIEKTLQEWEMTPREINQGDCDDFCYDALGTWQEANDTTKGAVTIGEIYDHPQLIEEHGVHYWIQIGWEDPTYYDAECPEGVDDWQELPFFNQ
jgi:hypothetical protein